jgi:hypothetical protein
MVCRKREREWIVAVEIPEEFHADTVMQNEVHLSEVSEKGYWPLVSLQGNVTQSTSTEISSDFGA